MSAAVLHGVPATTFGTDIWVDLPSRQYIRILNLCRRLGAGIVANTVVVLQDDSLVNFLYGITGLNSFAYEYKRAEFVRWLGHTVAVLPLERIYKSKSILRRPKDIAHLPLLEQTMKLRARLRRRRKR